MKLILTTILGFSLCISTVFAQVKENRSGEIIFHSIDKSTFQATSKEFTSKFNLEEKTVEIDIPLSTFVFKSKEIQSDFNSTDKMNLAQFSEIKITGTLASSSDLSKDGRHIVSIKGKANVKGKAYPFESNGLLVNENNTATISSSFLIDTHKFGFKEKNLKSIEVSMTITH